MLAIIVEVIQVQSPPFPEDAAKTGARHHGVQASTVAIADSWVVTAGLTQLVGIACEGSFRRLGVPVPGRGGPHNIFGWGCSAWFTAYGTS